MKIVLGLNSFHADSSAAIFQDNKLLYGIEEERINRIKHWAGLPVESIKACLNYNKIKLEDITDLAINTNPRSNLKEKSIYFFKNYILGNKKFEIFKRLKNKLNLKNEIEKKLNSRFNKQIKIHYIGKF